MPNPAQLTIHLFGAPEAWLAGAPLALHSQKARALLFYLAATGRAHTREHLDRAIAAFGKGGRELGVIAG